MKNVCCFTHAASSSHVNAVADQMINMISGENAEEESSGGSDEVMETASERLQTYLNSEMCDL
jgi:ABC-type polar amino acid transport system ATPase subunit